MNNPAIQSTWSHFIRRGALGAMLYGFFDILGVTLTEQLHQSPVEMGRMAAKVFLEHMDTEKSVNIQKNVILPSKLIIRTSSSKKMKS